MRSARALWVLLGVAAACRGKAAESRASADAAAERAAVSVVVEVDGKEVTRVDARALAGRVDLAVLLGERAPRAGWQAVNARGGETRRLDLERIAERYGEHDFVLYLEEASGQPSLGVFRRARPEQPAHVRAALAKPETGLGGIDRVIVHTRPREPAAGDGDEVEAASPPPALLVRVGASESALDPAKLATLEPGRKQGYRLADVVALAAPLERVKTVTVVGDGGESMTLEREALAGEGEEVRLKANRRGVWVLGRGETRLRGVTRIEIALAP